MESVGIFVLHQLKLNKCLSLRLWKGSLGVAVTWERLFSKHLGYAAAVDDDDDDDDDDDVVQTLVSLSMIYCELCTALGNGVQLRKEKPSCFAMTEKN